MNVYFIYVIQNGLLLLPFLWMPKDWMKNVGDSLVTILAGAAGVLIFYVAVLPGPSIIVKGMRAFVGSILGTLLSYVILLLFGAPIAALAFQTGCFAFVLGVLVISPWSVMKGCDKTCWNIQSFEKTGDEVWLRSATLCCAIGAYLGAMPIPLDWDRPWQQWPLTCLLGAYAGSLFAIVPFIYLMAKASKDSRKLA